MHVYMCGDRILHHSMWLGTVDYVVVHVHGLFFAFAVHSSSPSSLLLVAFAFCWFLCCVLLNYYQYSYRWLCVAFCMIFLFVRLNCLVQFRKLAVLSTKWHSTYLCMREIIIIILRIDLLFLFTPCSTVGNFRSEFLNEITFAHTMWMIDWLCIMYFSINQAASDSQSKSWI